MRFVSNRDIVIRSKHGHAIEFLKGVPTEVPRIMHAEIMEKGILPEEGPEQANAVAPPPAPVLGPEDGLERADAILEVIRAIVKRNNPSDFTGGGHPSATSVSSALGWKADQKEVGDVWKKSREEILRGADKKKD